MVNIEIPLHGLMYNMDRTFSYFIKRFDRDASGNKNAVEDFAQLMDSSRERKYDSSMEQLIPILDKFCTFPFLEKIKLFSLDAFLFSCRESKICISRTLALSAEKTVSNSPPRTIC